MAKYELVGRDDAKLKTKPCRQKLKCELNGMVKVSHSEKQTQESSTQKTGSRRARTERTTRPSDIYSVWFLEAENVNRFCLEVERENETGQRVGHFVLRSRLSRSFASVAPRPWGSFVQGGWKARRRRRRKARKASVRVGEPRRNPPCRSRPRRRRGRRCAGCRRRSPCG